MAIRKGMVMPRFTEEQLNKMCRPASETEEKKMKNAEQIVKKAMAASTIIQSSKYEIYGQGSYANNTNIRSNSDIDINICYTAAFYYDSPNGKAENSPFQEYSDDPKKMLVSLLGNSFNNLIPVDYTFQKYKNDIEKILVSYFGRSDVVRMNKCITVKGNTNRIQIDVVPTMKYRRYYCNTNYFEGVILYADNNQLIKVINFPKQHKINGIDRNTLTARRFKRLTRIFKHVRLKMDDDNYYSNENITSFLLECLAYNVPLNIYSNAYQCIWNDILKNAIIYLWNSTKEASKIYDKWVEVSELLCLMREHKWSKQDVHNYMYNMWNYLQLN